MILTSSFGLTVFRNSKQVFPIQFPNVENEQSFFGINGDKQIEFLTCPDGFTFDIKDLKCRHISKPKRFNTGSLRNEISCPAGFRGTLPNSLNCRTFLNCWDGIGFETLCTAHLLYSNITNRCEWPEESKCCEFWEKDPGSLVVDIYNEM